MAKKELKQFLWIIPDRSRQNWSLTINSVDVRSRVLSGSKISYGLIGEDLSCELILENSDKSLNGLFDENHIIIFKMDFDGGGTKQWEGEVESVIDDYSQNYTLKILGSHYAVRTTDINANKEYSNSTISDIRKDLISTYMTGFTSNGVVTNSKSISIRFVDKPIVDCMIDLNIQGEEDCYVDHTKDFISFNKNSRENDIEALVIDDNMFELKGLGRINSDKRNKVSVYGNVGDIPVIHITSKSQVRTREKIVTDSYAIDEDVAKEIADSELEKESNLDEEGNANCSFIPFLIPGYMTYITSPNQDITAPYRISKWTYNLYDETMEIQISQRRTIAKLFKDRILKDVSQERLVNPFSMTRSYILTFDNESKIITTASSGYILEGGFIRKDPSASQAIILSQIKSSDTNAANCHLLVAGDLLDGATFKFKADSSANFQSITTKSTSMTLVATEGKDIQLRIEINNNDTRIDTLGFYWTGTKVVTEELVEEQQSQSSEQDIIQPVKTKDTTQFQSSVSAFSI